MGGPEPHTISSASIPISSSLSSASKAISPPLRCHWMPHSAYSVATILRIYIYWHFLHAREKCSSKQLSRTPQNCFSHRPGQRSRPSRTTASIHRKSILSSGVLILITSHHESRY